MSSPTLTPKQAAFRYMACEVDYINSLLACRDITPGTARTMMRSAAAEAIRYSNHADLVIVIDVDKNHATFRIE